MILNAVNLLSVLQALEAFRFENQEDYKAEITWKFFRILNNRDL